MGFLNIKAGKMQLGEVMAFYQVTAQLFVPISALVGMTTVVQTLQVFAARILGVLDAKSSVTDHAKLIDIPQAAGDITFENVSLRYHEGGPFAVRNVTLGIPSGATACIVGPTGCGKSTLIVLLTRLYDPTEGKIRIGGVNIRRIRLRKLRHAIGNVLHSAHVFTGTIADNISYGDTTSTREEIEAAARVVELHDYIVAQPKGYDTPVGRGGEQIDQEHLIKLNLARAVVTDPSILTVDDTYAGLDEEVEERIRIAVRGALKDKTILIATSRLSVCEDADIVIVMQKGKIFQTGTHAALLAEPGLYRRMYMRQMGIEKLEETLHREAQVSAPSPLPSDAP
jgi:ABC-type multidrug transport system fused ATPase/permease subunit